MYTRCRGCGVQYDEHRGHSCSKVDPKKIEASPGGTAKKSLSEASQVLVDLEDARKVIIELKRQLAKNECPVCAKNKVKNRERVAAWRERNGSK